MSSVNEMSATFRQHERPMSEPKHLAPILSYHITQPFLGTSERIRIKTSSHRSTYANVERV
jgi:hypothetical protein